MAYRVKELAKLAGVTVRTLHHYHKIGLLKPQEVTKAGYRLYGQEEVEKLQQILFFRELDFKLSEIQELMNGTEYDSEAALRLQRRLLVKRQSRLRKLIKTIDATLATQQKGSKMSDKRRFEAFDKRTMEEYKEEAKRLYGEEIVEESHRRVGKMSSAEQERLAEDFNDICRKLLPLMDSDVNCSEVREVMGQLLNYINRFYDCDGQIFAGLSNLYCDDERFRKNIAKFHAELPEFMRKAMKEYAKTI